MSVREPRAALPPPARPRRARARALALTAACSFAFVTATTVRATARGDATAANATTSRPAPGAAIAPPTEGALIRRWLERSPEVASWRAQVGAARFDALTAGLMPNPEVSFGMTKLADGAPPDGRAGYELQVSMPLPLFGERRARVDAANEYVGVVEASVFTAVWDRASEIERAMVERAYADAHAVMLDDNLAELARIRRVAEVRAAAGASSAYDVLRVDAAAGTMRAARDSARALAARAETKLVALVADPTLTSAPVSREGLAAFQGPDDEAALVALALARRPDLVLARRSKRAAEADATRARREAIPTPSIFGSAYVVQGPYGLQIAGGVSMPLPLFNRNQGAVGRANAEADAARDASRAIEVRIRAEVTGAWRARANAHAALKTFRTESLVSASALLRRAEVTYQAGAFSIIELFDAYKTMWEARAEELELDRQRAESEVELERAAVLLPLAPRAR